jgi:hypothetical protein
MLNTRFGRYIPHRAGGAIPMTEGSGPPPSYSQMEGGEDGMNDLEPKVRL